MRELLFFLWGCLLGVLGTLGVFYLYNWIQKMRDRVSHVKGELQRLLDIREEWYEFQEWRRKNKQ